LISCTDIPPLYVTANVESWYLVQISPSWTLQLK